MVTASCEHCFVVQDLGKGTRDPGREPKFHFGGIVFLFFAQDGAFCLVFTQAIVFPIKEGETLFSYYFSVDIDILQRATIFL
jgi:hypothetical protein